MKRGNVKGSRFVILFLIGIYSFTTQATIVFVHLGPTIPAYVYVAFEQARLFNPDIQICLIANQQALDHSLYDFDTHLFTKIPCEGLERSIEHHLFVKKCPHSDAILDGFWRKAIERFFYIHEYMALRDLKEVVHLESDVMLYVDIATIKDALSEYTGIGAVFDCDTRCIPSFVYLANEQAIYDLVQFLASHASDTHFDMGLLALYRNSVACGKIDNLPLIMPEYTEIHSLINGLNQRSAYPEVYTQKIDLFHSIFDAAAIGQYMGGIDPMPGNSQPGFINETCLFNPSKLRFEWQEDEKGRKVPFAICNEAAYRINNLHIHSKRLHGFRS